eukprot:TRINITY_DN73912_c0_g1_i1.p1 TRINITY_DN73912_c0_g1~~TRINITY_DN73912_c0_g1_i1.p1  ORF type:complete len:579 (-),score=71.91 TRINITY_DN73912_c0_g1_i1:14-1750(-)
MSVWRSLGLFLGLLKQECWAQLVVDLVFDEASGDAKLASVVTAASDVSGAGGTTGPARPNVPLRHPTICDASVKQYAGYYTIRGTGASPSPRYFFWLLESRREPTIDPLLMWLNGGPGCSSISGLLTENGPCRLDAHGKSTVNNPYSWTDRANVIWVDQPSAVGFSSGPAYVGSENQVAAAMYGFLQQLFGSTELKKFAKHDFFLMGESYAGHYVPAIAHRIWRGNQLFEGRAINLKGIGIGNGITVPSIQYGYYEQMAVDGGLGLGGSLKHGVIKDPQILCEMRADVHSCIQTARACEEGSIRSQTCVDALWQCQSQIGAYQATGLSPYNMRQTCRYHPYCIETARMDTYLNLPEVQAQLGVNKTWTMCNRDVWFPFVYDQMKRFDYKLPDLLAGGIRVLIYAGDIDYICNWLGNKAWTLSLDWPHHHEFKAASDEPILLDGSMIGRARTAANLSFVQIFDAGHMVPTDQPAASLKMVNDFLANRLHDSVQDGTGLVSAKALLAVPNEDLVDVDGVDRCSVASEWDWSFRQRGVLAPLVVPFCIFGAIMGFVGCAVRGRIMRSGRQEVAHGYINLRA